MKADLFKSLTSALDAQQACAVVTDTASGQQCFVLRDEVTGELTLSDNHRQTALRMLADDVSGPIAESSLFVRVYGPALRMIIVGAVHIAQALVPMAQLVGYEVAVIDPRESFVQAGQLKEVQAVTDWPDDAMEELKPDARTAIVTLTHDPKLDDPALAAALRSDAFYIGSLGSTRTHAKRLQRLVGEGFSERDLQRIHGPVGLDIKAKTPSEIAVSIMAQVIATRRRAVS